MDSVCDLGCLENSAIDMEVHVYISLLSKVTPWKRIYSQLWFSYLKNNFHILAY